MARQQGGKTSNKVEIRQQVEFVKKLLLKGQDRKEIIKKFQKEFNLGEATVDGRMKQARMELDELQKEQAEAFKEQYKDLILQRQESIQKGLKRTVDSIVSKLNLTTLEKVKVIDAKTGQIIEKDIMVSALSVSDLQKIWQVLKTEAGEPTSIQKLQGDSENPLTQSVTSEISTFMQKNPKDAEKLISLLDKLS